MYNIPTRLTWVGGGTGRRAWFRTMWGNSWRFDSSPTHNDSVTNRYMADKQTYTSTLAKNEDGSLTLTIQIAASDVASTKEQLIEESVKTAEMPGFRKGKAPRKMVEERLDQNKLNEEILKKLLPKYYIQAITQHNLKPIMNPQIHVEELAEGKDWQFSATTTEAPVVELGAYKEAVKAVTAAGKIVIPGKKQEEPKLDDIVNALLEKATVTIPKILIQHEADRLLAQTLDEIKRLGLTLDQYLATTNRTPEQFRNEYETRAANDMKLEFILQKIAETEKITVEETEINEAIQKAKDDTERKSLEANRYVLASILRQQKTLDFLRNL